MSTFANAALLAEGPAAGWTFPLPIWVVVLGLLFVLYVISRRRSLRRRMAAKLESVAQTLQELNGLAADLTMHMFLEDGWENALSGKSQEALGEARTRKMDAFAALEALKQRHAEAARASSRRNSWRSKERALQNMYRLLSVEPLVIDGVSWLPGKLADELKVWFADVKSKLDSLGNALRECRLGRAELDKELAAVVEKHSALQADGFQWTDFVTEIEALSARRAKLGDPISDPMSAVGEVSGMRKEAAALLRELEEMVTRRTKFEAEVAKEMGGIEKVIASARGTEIAYGFPLTGDQAEPWRTQSLPVDEIVAVQTSASGAVTRARAALLRGDVTAFGKEAAHFRRITGATLGQYDSLVDSKDKVDQLAVVLRRSIDQLATRLATAGGVVSRMESEFHADDYAEAQRRVCEATAVGDRAEAEWQEIKDHYDALRFAEALECCERLSEDVSRAEGQLKGLERYRDEIRQSRETVLATLDRNRSAYDTLTKKVGINRHAVWTRTADRVAEIENLFKEAAGDKPAWKSLETKCEQLARHLKQLSTNVDEEKRAYDKAVEKLELARDAVRESGRSSGRDSARRVARTKHEEASRQLELLERDMKVAGSDWGELTNHALEVISVAGEATKRGDKDEEQFQLASVAIETAQEKLGRIRPPYSDKVQAANESFGKAKVAFQDRRWEDAADLAGKAGRSFQSSLNATGS